MLDKKLCFIGGGNMAEALIKGLVDKKVALPEKIVVAEPLGELRIFLNTTYKVHTVADNRTAVQGNDIIVLAVKPPVISSVLDEITAVISAEQIIISIAAGISTAVLSCQLGKNQCIVRAMPNTPAQIGAGATALCGGAAASPQALEAARTLFSAVGITVIVDETHMDAVTGLSGSGPAYVFLMIEALTDGGVSMGLSREVAQSLAVHTMIGAARMVAETGKHPGQLKDMVTSPGGTTIRGLQVLEQQGVRAALAAAVQQATERSRELAKSGKP